MPSAGPFRRDYFAGSLIFLLGLLAVRASLHFSLGSLQRMGPGMFPLAVGALLALCGLLIGLNALRAAPVADTPSAAAPPHPGGLPDLRGLLCIVAGTIAFWWLADLAGLLPASFAIVFLCALGDRGNSLRQALLLALVMTAIAGLVFWWGLKLQLPLLTWPVMVA